MPTYKRLLDAFTGQVNAKLIRRLDDNADIPVGSGNRDDIEYQAWLAAGNVPIDADPAPTAAAVLQSQRDAAVADIVAAGDPGFKIDRAAAAFWMVRFNDLRQQIAGIRAAIATGQTFADVKAAVNALPAMPPALTGQDVKDGIKANLLNGQGD